MRHFFPFVLLAVGCQVEAAAAQEPATLCGLPTFAPPSPGAGRTMSPDMVPGSLVTEAETSLRLHGCGKIGTPGRSKIVIVDFGRRSSVPRLWIVDLTDGDGSDRPVFVTHGKGSDPEHHGWAVHFSNVVHSDASSIGAYRGGGRYFGKHGASLRLAGLDPTNDAAARRTIVVHSTDPSKDYISAKWMARSRFGLPGRSNGCFAVWREDLEAVRSALEGGGLLYAGLSDRAHLKNDS